jgi:hypothetical protein
MGRGFKDDAIQAERGEAPKRTGHKWKAMLSILPTVAPSLKLPLDWNPRCLDYYSKLSGHKYMFRRVESEWWIWRII